ncbi:MAG: hypothetical protein KAV87_45655, partial [Desulfobacteraceae bacterium]|nr:hypothetical protein [Desulfobacteraceae bacterium]
ISRETLYGLAGNDAMIDPDNPPEWVIAQRPVGTIDWAWNNKNGGQSYTIFSLWVFINNKITNIYTKRFVGPAYHNPESVLNEIARHAKKTGTIFIGTDHGVGHFENIRFRLKVDPIRVFEIMYAGHYNRLEYNSAEDRYHVGRTESLDHVFAGIQNGRFAFPKLEQSQTFLDDILNVYRETDPTNRRVKYDHEGPDDFLHLMNYAYLVMRKMHQ